MVTHKTFLVNPELHERVSLALNALRPKFIATYCEILPDAFIPDHQDLWMPAPRVADHSHWARVADHSHWARVADSGSVLSTIRGSLGLNDKKKISWGYALVINHLTVKISLVIPFDGS